MMEKFMPFRIYRELQPDEHICIFGDPSEAVDYCAAVGVSKKYQDTPIVFNQRIESPQFGHELHRMAKFVEQRTHIWPTIGVERNTGQATIYVLTTLNYPDLFRMRIFDAVSMRESDKIGWLTTEATRKKMLDDLALALRQGGLKVYDKEIIDQFRSFVVSKKGKPQAESNKHDDLVMATAGAYQLFMLTPTKDSDVTSYMDWKKDADKWRLR